MLSPSSQMPISNHLRSRHRPSIHIMDDSSTYAAYQQPNPYLSTSFTYQFPQQAPLPSFPMRKRKRSELESSTSDDSDDGLGAHRFGFTFDKYSSLSPPASSPTHSRANTVVVESEEEDRPRVKRTKLADDFAGMKIRSRTQSLSPTSAMGPGHPLWNSGAAFTGSSLPVVEEPIIQELDLEDTILSKDATPMNVSRSPTPYPFPQTPDSAAVAVEELISPGVLAESNRSNVDVGGISDRKMHGSSWYEPEKDRIVITDLEDSDDDEGNHKSHGSFKISSAYFSRFNPLNNPTIIPDADQKALVTYHPPTVTTIETLNQPPVGWIEEIVEEPSEFAARHGFAQRTFNYSGSVDGFRVDVCPDEGEPPAAPMEVDMDVDMQ